MIGSISFPKIAAVKNNTQMVLDALIAHKLANDGNSPSLRQISDAVGMSSDNAIRYHLDKLESVGIIRRIGRERQIIVLGATWTPPELYTIAQRPTHRHVDHLADRDERCRNCGRPFGDNSKDGYCIPCYAHKNRTGTNRQLEKYAHESPFGWCLCGQGATVKVWTAMGEFSLCANCAREELER